MWFFVVLCFGCNSSRINPGDMEENNLIMQLIWHFEITQRANWRIWNFYLFLVWNSSYFYIPDLILEITILALHLSAKICLKNAYRYMYFLPQQLSITCIYVYLLNFYWIILLVEVFKICIYWTNACIDVQLFFFFRI